MSRQRVVEDGQRRATGDELRRRLLAGAPVTERRLHLAGVSTAVLEGGTARRWCCCTVRAGGRGSGCRSSADLMATIAVAPDLPGLGASRADEGPPAPDRVLAWLGELIDRTCAAPPVLVGASLGGSIAARFAAAHRDRLAGLVLVGMGGLAGKVRIPPASLLALVRHRPAERAHPPWRCCGRCRSTWRGAAADGGALGAVPGLLAGAGAHAQRAAGQPPPAARARDCARSRRRSWPGSRSRRRSSGGGRTG